MSLRSRLLRPCDVHITNGVGVKDGEPLMTVATSQTLAIDTATSIGEWDGKRKV